MAILERRGGEVSTKTARRSKDQRLNNLLWRPLMDLLFSPLLVVLPFLVPIAFGWAFAWTIGKLLDRYIAVSSNPASRTFVWCQTINRFIVRYFTQPGHGPLESLNALFNLGGLGGVFGIVALLYWAFPSPWQHMSWLSMAAYFVFIFPFSDRVSQLREGLFSEIALTPDEFSALRTVLAELKKDKNYRQGTSETYVYLHEVIQDLTVQMRTLRLSQKQASALEFLLVYKVPFGLDFSRFKYEKRIQIERLLHTIGTIGERKR